MDTGILVALTAVPFFIYKEIGGGAALSGIAGAAQAVAYTAVCIISSRWVTRLKNGLHLAVFGCGLFLIGFSALPFFPARWGCVFFSSLAAMGQALFWPAVHSWVSGDPDPRKRTQHMMWFNLSWCLGLAVGPLLAGPLFDANSLYPFAAVFCLGFGALLLVATLPHERSQYAEASAELLEGRAGHDRASEIFLWSAWCATLMVNILVGAMRNVLSEAYRGPRRHRPVAPLRCRRAGRAAHRRPGNGLFVAGVRYFFFRVCWFLWAWAGRTAGSTGSVRFLPSRRLRALAMAALAFTHSAALMAVAFAFAGLFNGVAFFSSAYYGVANAALKHRRAAINEAMVGIGGFVGSLVFGQLAAGFGPAAPFAMMPVLVAAGLCLQWALLVRARRSFGT